MRLKTRGFLGIKRRTLSALFPMLTIDVVRVPDRSGSLGSAARRASAVCAAARAASSQSSLPGYQDWVYQILCLIWIFWKSDIFGHFGHFMK